MTERSIRDSKFGPALGFSSLELVPSILTRTRLWSLAGSNGPTCRHLAAVARHGTRHEDAALFGLPAITIMSNV